MSGEITWRECAAVLRDILGGKKPEDCDRDTTTKLIVLNMLENREVTKPCRTCSKPMRDYSYWRLTGAARMFLEASEASQAGGGAA